MTQDLILFGIFLVMLLLLAIPLGRYMAKVYAGEKTIFDPVFRPIEKCIYRLTGVNPEQEMNWKQYAVACLWFNFFGLLALYIIQLQQGWLPFNPEDLPGVPTWQLALNTAISFMTNTNWQAYGGETTMSYFSQMAGLTVQNFVSAAVGMAVVIALIRGLTRRTAGTIGNFWVDLVRSTVWIRCDIEDIIGASLRQLADQIKGWPLAVKIPDDTPLLRGDCVLLGQVMVNLVDNAIKYSPRGSGIEIKVGRGGDSLLVSVADHGAGIPEADLPRVFDKFFRIQRRTGNVPGTGLGLSICKGLVEAHGGKIWAENAAGGGAVISFTLPISDSKAAVPPESE